MRWIRSASFIGLSLFLHASLAVSWFLLQPMLSASTAESMPVAMVTLAAPAGISQSVNVADNKPEGAIKPEIESDVEPKLALPVKKKIIQKKSLVKHNPKSKRLEEHQIKKTIVEQSNQQQANISDDNVGVNKNQQASQMASPSFAIEGPKALRIQHPNYPDRARKLGKEGYVNVLYDIDENGRVVNLEVVDSSPKGMFEREVKRAMNRWYYEKIPAKGLKKTFLFKIDGSINLS